jgi:hypothetical protein
MSTFQWKINDASEEPMPVQSGGEIDIADLSVVIIESWGVETPDSTVARVPQASGTVEAIKASGTSVGSASTDEALILRSLSADRKLFRIVVLTVLALLGLAFVAVVANDIRRGKLDFMTYAMFVASFVVGRGSTRIGGDKYTKHGDGSG